MADAPLGWLSRQRRQPWRTELDLERLLTYYRLALDQRHLISERDARPGPTAQVYRKEAKYLLRILKRFHVSPRDREDLVQDVFLILCMNSDRFDESRPIRPYLYGIAMRLACAHFRKQRRHVVGPVPDTEDPRPDPEEAVKLEELRALLNAALAAVPQPRRAVLTMRDLDEMPLTDVSSVLSVPLFTAYARLRKARRELASAVRRRMLSDLEAGD